MSHQGYEWRAYWDEHGTRVDDATVISIRVGVIDIDSCLSIAISVASAPPVAITGQVAAGLSELMQWAQDEHKMLGKQDQRYRTAAARPSADLPDVNQTTAWLDDIDAQLSDIATQVRATRPLPRSSRRRRFRLPQRNTGRYRRITRSR